MPPIGKSACISITAQTSAFDCSEVHPPVDSNNPPVWDVHATKLFSLPSNRPPGPPGSSESEGSCFAPEIESYTRNKLKIEKTAHQDLLRLLGSIWAVLGSPLTLRLRLLWGIGLHTAGNSDILPHCRQPRIPSSGRLIPRTSSREGLQESPAHPGWEL